LLNYESKYSSIWFNKLRHKFKKKLHFKKVFFFFSISITKNYHLISL
jgi:hypothetical protein